MEPVAVGIQQEMTCKFMGQGLRVSRHNKKISAFKLMHDAWRTLPVICLNVNARCMVDFACYLPGSFAYVLLESLKGMALT